MASCAAHNAVGLLQRWSAAVISGSMRLRSRGSRSRQRLEAQQLMVIPLMAARKDSLLDGCLLRRRRKCCWSLLPAARVGMEARRQWRLRLLVDRGGCSGAGPKAAAGRSCGDAARQREMLPLLVADRPSAELAARVAVASSAAEIVFVSVAAASGLGAEGRRLRLLSGPRMRMRWRNDRSCSHAVPREVAAAASPVDRVNVCGGFCVGESRAGEGMGKGKG